MRVCNRCRFVRLKARPKNIKLENSMNYPTGARDDKSAPFNASYADAAQLRAIERRAHELCAAGFDERDDIAKEWMYDEESTIADVALAAIDWQRTGDGEALTAALLRLREVYIAE